MQMLLQSDAACTFGPNDRRHSSSYAISSTVVELSSTWIWSRRSSSSVESAAEPRRGAAAPSSSNRADEKGLSAAEATTSLRVTL